MLAPEFLIDPYPFYAYLRQHDSVHRTRQGSWLVTGHDAVMEAFSNPLLGNAPSRHASINSRNAGRHVSASVAQTILPFLDRPEQIRPRRIIGSVFRSALRDDPIDIEAYATARLDGLRTRDRIDLISDYAKPISIWSISQLMDLPASDADRLSRWASAFFYLFAPMPSEEIRADVDRALEDFRRYFRDLIEDRRGGGGGDIISRLLAERDEQGPLDDGAIIDNCMLLFADGVENVDRGFANAMLALDDHLETWKRLDDEPDLAQSIILEALRFDPPAQMIGRVAREDVTIGGRLIRKDGAVLLGTASANRDPAAFAHPDRFDIARPADDLLTFGRGRHSCLGASLVRAEMVAALVSLRRLTKKVSIERRNLVWEPRLGHRWLRALPVRLVYR